MLRGKLLRSNGGAVSVDELKREALKLSPDERELLAMELLASLRSELKYEEEWAAEVDRRARE